MTDELVTELCRALGDKAQPHADLGQLTTYRVGGKARVLVRAESLGDLEMLAQVLQGTSDLPEFLVVGRGSNMLVSDDGFEGVALELGDGFEVLEWKGSIVDLGGRNALPVAARKLASLGLSGFEWAVGVPGSIGGAVKMNAGGHGSDMSASLISAQVVNLLDTSFQVKERAASSLGLAYRQSNLTAFDVVIRARLGLDVGDESESKKMISEIVSWRRTNQPGGQNAGSVFTNPVGELKAAQLIEGAALKGIRHNSAQISEKHANFIQSSPDGKAQDVYELISLVRQRVLEQTGVELHTEIKMIGFSRGK